MSKRWPIIFVVITLPLMIMFQNCIPSGGGKGPDTKGQSPATNTPPPNSDSTAPKTVANCTRSILESVSNSTAVASWSAFSNSEVVQSALAEKQIDCISAIAGNLNTFCTTIWPTQATKLFMTKIRLEYSDGTAPFEKIINDTCQAELATGTCTNSGGLLSGETCKSNADCCSNSCNLAGSFGTCAGPDLSSYSCLKAGKSCNIDGDCCSGQSCIGAPGNRVCVPPGSVKFGVTIASSNAGTITSSPSGINCPGSCTANVDAGTNVSLTFSANSGYRITGWNGFACAAPGSTCQFQVLKSESGQVNTEQIPTYTLSVSATGSGVITSTPAGINCGSGNSQCSAAFQEGTSVTLNQTANTYNAFSSWNGACSGSGSCQVSMTQNRTVGGLFSATHYKVTVAKNLAAGTVTSTPAGINCGATCEAYLPVGSNVDIKGSYVTGNNATYSNQCHLSNLSSNISCTVTYSLETYTYTTYIFPNFANIGTVNVNSSQCSGTCTQTVTYGDQMTLEAHGGSGYSFKSWSGMCSGTNYITQFTISGGGTCYANFCQQTGTSCLNSTQCCTNFCNNYTGKCTVQAN